MKDFTFRSLKFDDLSTTSIKKLHGLTNDPQRGDVRDTGSAAGSLFRNQLDDRLCGESFPNSEVIIARPKWNLRYAGWCMMTRHDIDPETGRRLLVPSAQVGFYVHPDFRRQGLGRRLIQEAQDLARKTGVGRLLANPWNASSRTFFLSCGFQELQCYVSGFSGGMAAYEVDFTAVDKTG